MELNSPKDLKNAPQQPDRSELQHALDRIRREIQEGVVHGFFDMTVSCEIIAGKKRRLTIRSGNSYQHVIGPEELGG
jgi:hypothetical protein